MRIIEEQKHGDSVTGLAFAALGVVFGDIGTSPLYALKETFFQHGHALERTSANVLGALSLIFWSLVIVVTLKYVFVVMKADNNGEGGIFALLALLRNGSGWKKGILPTLIVMGACLLYADGVITPAISVLSAYEGLEVVNPAFRPYVIPATVLTLLSLFSIQKWGTHKIGKLFGPIMFLWFTLIAGLGVWQIIQHPEVLWAVNPIYAVRFLAHHRWFSLLILGAVVLAVTGGEALYADMGHFGNRPIRLAWLVLVCPALLLNYFGQGAKLLGSGDIPGNNLFYSIVPEKLLIPMVCLATAATVIASQALISGAFSLTKQAIQLGLVWRFDILHTHDEHMGQIYIPAVNWTLCVGTLLLVKSFGSSEALAAAYGIAVTGTMAITTLAFLKVALDVLKWRPAIVWPLCTVFVFIDLIFFCANTLKFWNGGYVPILIAFVLFVLMDTWQWGRGILFHLYLNYGKEDKTRFSSHRLVDMMNSVVTYKYHHIYLASAKIIHLEDPVPMSLQLPLETLPVIPEKITYITVATVSTPYHLGNRVEVNDLFTGGSSGSCRIRSIVTFWGYREKPSLYKIVKNEFADHEGRLIAGKEWFLFQTANFFCRQRARLFAAINSKISRPAFMFYDLGDELSRLNEEAIPIRIKGNGVASIAS